NEAVRIAAIRGHLDVVKYLLSLPGVDSKALFKDVVWIAAENGHSEVVKFLLALPGFVLTPCRTEGEAAWFGHLEVVQFLLTLPNVDAIAVNNGALRNAAARVPGVDPTALYNHAVNKAAENGHEEVVEFLLRFPGVKLD
ncbi:hypothetical protein HDU76_011148, partial [Blyttiomyces sp. JEL0837]